MLEGWRIFILIDFYITIKPATDFVGRKGPDVKIDQNSLDLTGTYSIFGISMIML